MEKLSISVIFVLFSLAALTARQGYLSGPSFQYEGCKLSISDSISHEKLSNGSHFKSDSLDENHGSFFLNDNINRFLHENPEMVYSTYSNPDSLYYEEAPNAMPVLVPEADGEILIMIPEDPYGYFLLIKDPDESEIP